MERPVPSGNAEVKGLDGVNEKKKLRTVKDFLKKDDSLAPSKMHILAGLQGKPVYQGTVDKETVRRRRAKNKAARIARRKSR